MSYAYVPSTLGAYRRRRTLGCGSCGSYPRSGLNYAPGVSVPGYLGDSCTIQANGARLCTSAPAVASTRGGGRFGSPMAVHGTIARNVYNPYNSQAMPNAGAIPVSSTPTQMQQNWWQRSAGSGQGKQYGSNNRYGQSYGTSNYAPWNTSPVCSDPTSQYYNPQDSSCATGNTNLTEICTDPTSQSYNPNNPSCASILAQTAATVSTAATAAAPTTDYTSYLLIGGGLLLVVMLFKK